MVGGLVRGVDILKPVVIDLADLDIHVSPCVVRAGLPIPLRRNERADAGAVIGERRVRRRAVHKKAHVIELGGGFPLDQHTAALVGSAEILQCDRAPRLRHQHKTRQENERRAYEKLACLPHELRLLIQA